MLVAASWGPLSHTLKLVETSERGERSIRVVLAQDYSLRAAQREKLASNAAKSHAKKDSSQTERLLNAVPDNLEAAQAVHFDIDAPVIPVPIARIENDVGRHTAFEFSLPYTHPPDDTLARGPPMA